MKLGIVITGILPETVFNAFRLANFSIKEGDDVAVFLLGEGVELEEINDKRFDVQAQVRSFVDIGGKIMACGTCLKLRDSEGTDICPVSTMKDLHELIKDSDKVMTF
ncbi:MAG: DsrE family protein [Deltaproteobacteria bacterium]|nr:DsrE family protein [Deltaproteobacteria bacterium]